MPRTRGFWRETQAGEMAQIKQRDIFARRW